SGFRAGALARELGARLKGGGGGKPDVAQGEGKDGEALAAALESIPAFLESTSGAAVDTPRGPT
ncbi:MAG: DHHA1 domain-containing protein, partial [Planctomycetota bacterium]